MPALQIMSQLLASSDIEFAGGENGNYFDALDAFWNPQVRDTRLVKLFAQLGKIDIYRAEQHERFAFGFVLHSHNRDHALVFSGEI